MTLSWNKTRTDPFTNILTVNLPGTNNYSFDLNGNLLGDGTRSFAYDDENELISVWVASTWSNSFAYDGKMRRRIEKDYSWSAGTSSWQQTNEIHFVYDGNVVIQERNSNNVVQVTYTRGNDLSGTMQGAGGIGGLLARTDTNNSTFYHADGNGNVTCLTDTNQSIVAKYLYDPFGNTLSMSGTLAAANTYRFSSKEWNANSGLYYYLYRFYDPILQRWPNQDPIQEFGGINLYEFVLNAPTDDIDTYGLVFNGLPPGGITTFPKPPGPPGWLPPALSGIGVGVSAYECYQAFHFPKPKCVTSSADQGQWVANCRNNVRSGFTSCSAAVGGGIGIVSGGWGGVVGIGIGLLGGFIGGHVLSDSWIDSHFGCGNPPPVNSNPSCCHN